MKLDNVKRIVVEDFSKTNRSDIEKLGFIINNIFEQLQQILTKNVTIADNLNESLIDIDVSVDALGNPMLRTQFKYNLKGPCRGTQVIFATNLDNFTTYPVSQPFISFQQLDGGLIQVKNITGLQANNKYRLTVRVTGN